MALLGREREQGLVHVFVPSYNRAHLLRQAIDSVFAQTYTNWHIIIVDDASTDGAADVAREYARAYPERITAVCKRRNLGVCDSLNRALPSCRKGEFFAFFADDDVWLPEKLEKQIAAFADNDALGLVFSDALIIDNDGTPTGERFSDNFGRLGANENITRRLFLSGNIVCAVSAMASYESIASMGFSIPLEVGFTTDLYMWLVMSSMYEVKYLQDPLTFYRVASGSASQAYRRVMDWESFFLRREAYQSFSSIRELVTPEEAVDRLVNIARVYARTHLREGRLGSSIRFGVEVLRLKSHLMVPRSTGTCSK